MDLSLIRPCLSDFELPVVLVDLILDYVRRMYEERYYTWKELKCMPKDISYTFILNMKIVTVDTLSRRRTCNEGECEVDVIRIKNNWFNITFTMGEICYKLIAGTINNKCPPIVRFWDGRRTATITLRPHEFE